MNISEVQQQICNAECGTDLTNDLVMLSDGIWNLAIGVGVQEDQEKEEDERTRVVGKEEMHL